jgi:hypothetical protein
MKQPDQVRNDGGPAFGHGNPEQGGSEGMSLRDWFAGQALTGIMGPNYDWFTSGTEEGSRSYDAVCFAYHLADAMLEARKVKP